MSYDIDIRKDELFSEVVDVVAIRAFIGSLPHITTDYRIRLTFESGEDYYMEIYLAYYGMEQEEFLLDEEAFIAQGMVNCINMCIPYGHWSNQNKLPYLQICKSIAEYLQWEAYDLQPGKDVREVYVIDGV